MASKPGHSPGPWRLSWCLRRILRIPFSAYVTNEDIYQRAGHVLVSEMVQSRRPPLFGHVARCDAEQDHARALKAMVGGPQKNWKRPVGRSCQTWLRAATSDLLPRTLVLTRPGEGLRRDTCTYGGRTQKRQRSASGLVFDDDVNN